MDWVRQMGLAAVSLVVAGTAMAALEGALGISSGQQTQTIIGVGLALLLARGVYLRLDRRRSAR